MLNIEKSIRLKKELDALRPLKKEEEQRIMQKFRLDWNFHSNNLEGNSLTYGETKALILHGITAQGKPLKDHFEITGHNEAVNWVLDVVKQERKLTESFIRELHTLILKEPYEVNAITPDGKPTKKRVQVGEYKSTPNHVKTATGEVFRFATPEETPAKMHDLMEWVSAQKTKEGLNPILFAVEFHYKFILIHPFDDGNGRVARILMNFILMEFGYPPVIVKTDDKENYFAALRQADGGKLEPFIEYISKQLNHSLQLIIKGAKGESIEEPDDLEKEVALLDQRLKGIGQLVEITRSREAILEIYTNGFMKLSSKFRLKGEIFSKYYVDTSFEVSVLTERKYINITNINISDKRSPITKHTTSIVLEIKYKAFKQLGFGEFNHIASIYFKLYNASYSVNNRADVTFEKLYGQQLTEQEIDELVNSEIRLHTDFINQKIDAFNKKKEK